MTEVTIPPATADTGAKPADTAGAAAAVAGKEPIKADAYKVPDAYKDKPWASKIKSDDDLWKQLDNTQQLIGKKSIAPDFDKATPEEIEDYVKQTRPADVKAYQFAEGTDDAIKGVLSESLFKNGVTPYQANSVIKAFQDAEKVQTAAFYSTDGMSKEFEKSFGADWKKISGDTINVIKANVSPEDAKALDGLPNPMLALTLRAINQIVTKYGIEEKGAHTSAETGGHKPPDMAKVRSDLRTQIAELPNRPHTAAEKDDLIAKLNATYE